MFGKPFIFGFCVSWARGGVGLPWFLVFAAGGHEGAAAENCGGEHKVVGVEFSDAYDAGAGFDDEDGYAHVDDAEEYDDGACDEDDAGRGEHLDWIAESHFFFTWFV